MPAIGITGGISTGKSTFCQCVRELMVGIPQSRDRAVPGTPGPPPPWTGSVVASGRALPNAKFFDADQAAHELVGLVEVKQQLVREFGAEIFSAGNLNRAALRVIILEDAAKKSALEKILHPRIRRQWSAEANKHRQSPDFFFADIPLLYETGGQTLCDRVVVVACSPRIQVLRLLERGRNRTGHRSASRTDSSRGEPVATTRAATERVATAKESGDVATSLREVTAAEIEAMIKSQMPLEEKIRKADHVVWNNGNRSVLKGQAEKLVELWRQEKWTRA
jgi:dephospho-CoA kinase